MTPGRIDPQTLRTSLEQLSDTELSRDLATALSRVTEATRHLFGCDGGGVMLLDADQALGYVPTPDEGSRRLESAQRDLGVGPCVDSLVLDRLVHTEDVTTDPRWPELREPLHDAGVHAVLGVPIRSGASPVGSLNVYRAVRAEWSDAERDAIAAYGRVVEHLVTSALSAHSQQRLARQLQEALDHRVTIDRAVGYVMATQQLDAVGAFDVLRRTARSQRVKVAELAADLLGLDPQD
jgi:GAF domain-containing protein